MTTPPHPEKLSAAAARRSSSTAACITTTTLLLRLSSVLPAALLLLLLPPNLLPLRCVFASASSASPTTSFVSSSSRPPYADPEFDCSVRRLALRFAKAVVSDNLWSNAGGAVFDALELGAMCGDVVNDDEGGRGGGGEGGGGGKGDEGDGDGSQQLPRIGGKTDAEGGSSAQQQRRLERRASSFSVTNAEGGKQQQQPSGCGDGGGTGVFGEEEDGHRRRATATASTSSEASDFSDFDDADAPSAATNNSIFVDACVGSDDSEDSSDSGSISKPFRTIHHAVNVARSRPEIGIIYLRSGSGRSGSRAGGYNDVHYIESTILLTEQDSGLMICGYPGDFPSRPIVSAAVPLIGLKWSKAKDKDDDTNLWVAHIPESTGLDDLPGIHLSSNRSSAGTGNGSSNGRMVVARYPNTPNPFIMNEEYSGDNRIKMGEAQFLPPKKYTDDDFTYLTIESPSRHDAVDGQFGRYTVGIGGSCEVFDPPVSFWCSNETSRIRSYQYKIPSGVVLNASYLPHLPNYTAGGMSQAVINAWRPSRWFNWMFAGEYDFHSQHFTFTKGGFQGAIGEKTGGDWFIENVFEELDYPGEYYYSRQDRLLYVYLNATAGMKHPDDLGLLSVPTLEGIFNVTGSSPSASTSVARDIIISDLILTGTRHTYLSAPHAPPSGGDWSLERRGAIYLENTNSVTIEGCLIDKVDGHAIMISGMNRHTKVMDNEIRYVGGSGIASWGRTDSELDEGGFMAHKGLFPDGNIIQRNVVHEVGHYEKQNSFYVQAKTARSVITHNVFFNGPRAGINFNDGFTGGDVMEYNLIFNSCRESGDHGPFNSWDRQPYLTPGSPDGGVGMDWRSIRHNFFIANYQSQDGVDTDDGSQYYNVTYNFLVYGDVGLKGDFGGHDVRHMGNIYGFVNHCVNDRASQLEGHEDYYQKNKCIVRDGGNYANFADKNAWPKMGNNDIYVKGGTSANMTVNDYPVSKFQRKFPGVDDGTRVHDLVNADAIIGWAKDILSNKGGGGRSSLRLTAS